MSGLGEHSLVLSWAIDLAAGLIGISFVCCFVRLAKGPKLPDRVVSLDLISVVTVAFVGLTGIATGISAILDVAIGLALMGFLVTVAFAWYADQRTDQSDAGENPPDQERRL